MFPLNLSLAYPTHKCAHNNSDICSIYSDQIMNEPLCVHNVRSVSVNILPQSEANVCAKFARYACCAYIFYYSIRFLTDYLCIKGMKMRAHIRKRNARLESIDLFG